MILYPALFGFPHFEQISFTLEAGMEAGKVTICPFSPVFLGFRCFFLKLIPSTITLAFFGKTCKITPFLPRSFPEIIKTVSPFFIFTPLEEFRNNLSARGLNSEILVNYIIFFILTVFPCKLSAPEGVRNFSTGFIRLIRLLNLLSFQNLFP